MRVYSFYHFQIFATSTLATLPLQQTCTFVYYSTMSTAMPSSTSTLTSRAVVLAKATKH